MLVALLVGGIEAVGLPGHRLAFAGPFWDAGGNLNHSFGYLGFVVVGVFVLCWISSIIVYRWIGYDHLEVTKNR